MNTKYIHITLAIWIFVVVSVFTESYPNRPTAYDLEGIVIFGKECVLGVNERCQATQYSTNPVNYYVSPPFVKTNSAGWYLDQSTMGTMASKIESLVQYYADPDTVYNGTTNITMFTVAGLFTELDIGNHEDKFTQTFASGTNSAVYGDSPWWICYGNLDERYKVLNALACCRFLNKIKQHYIETKGVGDGADYDDSVTKFLAASWIVDTPDGIGFGAYMDSIGGGGSWLQQRFRGTFKILGGYTTNLTANKIDAYCSLGTPYGRFYDYDPICPGENSNTYVQVITINNPNLATFPYEDSTIYGNSEAPIPDGSPDSFYGWFVGWESVGPNQLIITFNFNYCE